MMNKIKISYITIITSSRKVNVQITYTYLEIPSTYIKFIPTLVVIFMNVRALKMRTRNIENIFYIYVIQVLSEK